LANAKLDIENIIINKNVKFFMNDPLPQVIAKIVS